MNRYPGGYMEHKHLLPRISPGTIETMSGAKSHKLGIVNEITCIPQAKSVPSYAMGLTR